MLTTQQPKVVSEGNIVISAEINVGEEETNVGFEWRRIDWPDDFESNKGAGYIVDGQMEGYIRNLNTNYLWKYRPYFNYEGQYYYGDWVGIDPTNTSYFEPTVHTYATANVNGNSAQIKGYAQRGTEDVVSQGFVYWKSGEGASTAEIAATSIPKGAITVEADGTIMQTTLSALDFNSTYTYAAFMKTSDNKLYYGNEQTFTIGADPAGIHLSTVSNTTEGKIVGIYDITGRRLHDVQRGINIIKYDNGQTKKVLIP